MANDDAEDGVPLELRCSAWRAEVAVALEAERRASAERRLFSREMAVLLREGALDPDISAAEGQLLLAIADKLDAT